MPKAINKTLSVISYSKEKFIKHKEEYQSALANSGHKHKLEYQLNEEWRESEKKNVIGILYSLIHHSIKLANYNGKIISQNNCY